MLAGRADIADSRTVSGGDDASNHFDGAKRFVIDHPPIFDNSGEHVAAAAALVAP